MKNILGMMSMLKKSYQYRAVKGSGYNTVKGYNKRQLFFSMSLAGLLSLASCAQTKVVKRAPNTMAHAGYLQKMDCKLVGVQTDGKEVTLEEKKLEQTALTAVDEFGYKGYYFDLASGVGGFSLYQEDSKYIVERELEEFGPFEKEFYSKTPFKSKDLHLNITYGEGKSFKAFYIQCR